MGKKKKRRLEKRCLDDSRVGVLSLYQFLSKKSSNVSISLCLCVCVFIDCDNQPVNRYMQPIHPFIHPSGHKYISTYVHTHIHVYERMNE